MGQGYCSRCYNHEKRMGTLVHVRRSAKIRSRNGEQQHFCFDCESWKNKSEFTRAKRPHRTRCWDCILRIRREAYQTKRAMENAYRRDKNAIQTQKDREADRKAKAKGDSWYSKGLIEVDVVQRWLDSIYSLSEEISWAEVAQLTGVHERGLYRVRTGNDGSKVSVDVAERIARAADTMEEFRELTRPGIPGWSKHSDYCMRCGRYDLPHRAQGMCRRCYQMAWWYKVRGRVVPPAPAERWAKSHVACVECGTTKAKHQAHGFCANCYRKHRRTA